MVPAPAFAGSAVQHSSFTAAALLLLVLPFSAHGADAGVSSARWRLVGRSVASSWTVSRVRFHRASEISPETAVGSVPGASACGAEIAAKPWRGVESGHRNDGSAFGGPSIVHLTGNRMVADAFEDNGVDWSTGVPCSASDDECFIGFRWFGTQAAAAVGGPTNGFVTVSKLGRTTVAPRCIELTQSTQPGELASKVIVQYWDKSLWAWRNHTAFTTSSGGTNLLQLPMVPIGSGI